MMRLTDRQIAEAFGDTLSHIYREKMEELDNDLQPTTDFLQIFNVPKYTDADRSLAKRIVRFVPWIDQRFKAIEHMKKIRSLYRKIKDEPQEGNMDIEKARAVPITDVYDFQQKRVGQNVRCPFHEDRSPSASIKYNRLHCFSCGAKHDSISLFMALNKVSFKDAVTSLSA